MPEEFAATAETMVDVLRSRALRSRDQRAFLFLESGEREGASLTFGELDLRARAIASRLVSLGASEKQVLLLYPPGLEFIEAFFGCLYAGCVAVPSYSTMLSSRNISRLQFLINDAGATLMLTDSRSQASYESSTAQETPLQIPLLASDRIRDEEGHAWAPVEVRPEALAYIQYTSGSTSEPKGVMLDHSSVMHNQRMIRFAFGNTEGSWAVSWLPHFHDMGLVGVIQQTVYAGLSTVLMSPLEFIRRPARWLRAISKYRARGSGAPNFAYDLCVDRIKPEELEGLDLSCWKRAFNGSEPVRADTLDRFAARFSSYGFDPASFYPCYGLAEATLFVSGRSEGAPLVVRKVEARALEDCSWRESSLADSKATRRIVGCGHAWGEERIVIVDPKTCTRSAPGQVGEIWVAGGHVAKGYWGREEEPREVFGARLADGDETAFLRTGDLGCIVDGELFITGRLKDLIILRGRNHYPQDIEATVAVSHPSLLRSGSAAFSVEVDEQEELVVVQEVKSRTSPETSVEIYASIRQALAEDHALKPYAVILLKPNMIPKTSSGKVRRSACRIKFLTDAFAEESFC